MSQNLQELALTFVETPSRGNREALILASVPLVRSLVGRIAVPDHHLASREDLENAALVGLMEAMDNYCTNHGTPFASYVYARIRGAVVDYLRSIDVVPREQRKRLAEAEKARDILAQLLGGEPEDQDIADYLGISLKEYHGLLVHAQNRFALSLDQPAGDEEELRLHDVISDLNSRNAAETVESESTLNFVQKLIRQLPEREQNVLALYYYEKLTLREIGELLELTEARISQILGKIHARLRHKLDESLKVS